MINRHKVLDDGWIAMFNGFQYKLVYPAGNWTESRATCQELGGDLAVFGIQDMESRT